MDLIVTPRAVIEAHATDSIYFVEENDTGLFRACELEELAHHSRAFADVFLHEFRANHADKGGVGAVGHRSRAQRLACTGRAKEQHALRRIDTQAHEALRLQERRLYDFTQFLNLFLDTADIAVCHIRLVFDLHHRDGGINLGGQGDLDLVLVAVDTDPHALFNVGGGDALAEADDKLGDLLHIDDVLIFAVGIAHVESLAQATEGA